MGKKKVENGTVSAWLKYRESRLGENPQASLWSVCQELAIQTGYRPETVLLYLDQEYGKRKQAADRASHRRSYARKKRLRIYRRNQMRLERQAEQYLAIVFQSRELANLETITAQIHDQIPERQPGQFKEPMIERLLHRYMIKNRGPPYLIEVQPGVYRARI